jgi:hypothetical protein
MGTPFDDEMCCPITTGLGLVVTLSTTNFKIIFNNFLFFMKDFFFFFTSFEEYYNFLIAWKNIDVNFSLVSP